MIASREALELEKMRIDGILRAWDKQDETFNIKKGDICEFWERSLKYSEIGRFHSREVFTDNDPSEPDEYMYFKQNKRGEAGEGFTCCRPISMPGSLIKHDRSPESPIEDPKEVFVACYNNRGIVTNIAGEADWKFITHYWRIENARKT